MRRRLVALFLLYAALIGGGWLLGHWLTEWAIMDIRPSNEPEIHRMVMLVSAVYVVASAVPFVPGAEIGFSMIAVLGSRIAVLVYACMVLALTLAYAVGRFVPARVTAALLGGLGMERGRRMILRTAELDPDDRLALFMARSPHRILPFLLRHRYIALALALNLPGNTVLGGGGGLALAAGMSGLFAPLRFVATILLAVAPLPALILLTGYQP